MSDIKLNLMAYLDGLATMALTEKETQAVGAILKGVIGIALLDKELELMTLMAPMVTEAIKFVEGEIEKDEALKEDENFFDKNEIIH